MKIHTNQIIFYEQLQACYINNKFNFIFLTEDIYYSMIKRVRLEKTTNIHLQLFGYLSINRRISK